jgi:exosortase
LLCVLPFVLPDSIQTMGFLSTSLFEAIGVGLSAAGALLVIQQKIPFSVISDAERWIGFAIVAVGEGLRLWATHTSHYTYERVSFIVALAGVFVMVGGRRIMRWAGWAVAFLIFMLPLPGPLDGPLASNLQTGATIASTYVLQTVGVGAVRSGNVISVGRDGIPMEVEKACSGLHMLTVFVALCVGVVLLVDFPAWQRIVIVISSVPIALAVNVIRITGTGILFTILPASQENLRQFFHGGAGLAMPPLALLLLFLEYKILSNLFVEDDDDLAHAVGLGSAPRNFAAGGVPPAKPLPPVRPVMPQGAPGRPVAAKPAIASPHPVKPPSMAPVAVKPPPVKPLPVKPVAPKPAASKPPMQPNVEPLAAASPRQPGRQPMARE